MTDWDLSIADEESRESPALFSSAPEIGN